MDIFTARRISKVASPAELIAAIVPQSHARQIDIGAYRRPIIEHGIDEQLKCERNLIAIMSHQCEARGQAPTCARTANRDTVRKHAEFFCLCVQPA